MLHYCNLTLIETDSDLMSWEYGKPSGMELKTLLDKPFMPGKVSAREELLRQPMEEGGKGLSRVSHTHRGCVSSPFTLLMVLTVSSRLTAEKCGPHMARQARCLEPSHGWPIHSLTLNSSMMKPASACSSLQTWPYSISGEGPP